MGAPARNSLLTSGALYTVMPPHRHAFGRTTAAFRSGGTQKLAQGQRICLARCGRLHFNPTGFEQFVHQFFAGLELSQELTSSSKLLGRSLSQDRNPDFGASVLSTGTVRFTSTRAVRSGANSGRSRSTRPAHPETAAQKRELPMTLTGEV